jgi:hypothetical protein
MKIWVNFKKKTTLAEAKTIFIYEAKKNKYRF